MKNTTTKKEKKTTAAAAAMDPSRGRRRRRRRRRKLPIKWLLSSFLSSSCSLHSSVKHPTTPFPQQRLADYGHRYRAHTELDGRTCPPTSPASPTKAHKPRFPSNPYGFTSSDDDNDDDDYEHSLFSSDHSSELYYSNRRRKQRRKQRRRRRSDGFCPVVRMEVEKRGGFAVEKDSSDPYGDFRSSMLEMIMEGSIIGAEELQGLLESYVSLNSRRHHEVIRRVFRDICQALFQC